MKERNMHTTVIVIESAHEPSEWELRKTVVAAVSEGINQGFEPIRAKGYVNYDNIVEVVDREKWDKWIRI